MLTSYRHKRTKPPIEHWSLTQSFANVLAIDLQPAPITGARYLPRPAAIGANTPERLNGSPACE